jgi:hypothetical protein
LSLDRGPDGRITLRAAPPPGARLLVLDLRADVAVTDPRIDGHPAPVLRGPGRRTRVRWEASPGGFALSFASAGPGALEVRYAAVTEAWPAAATPLPKRPPDVMAFAESDSTIVTGSRRLAWRSAP